MSGHATVLTLQCPPPGQQAYIQPKGLSGHCCILVRDGESHNLSWNCGEEGDTESASVLRLRARQMRNMAAALMLSHGVPMIQMGDEYGHSKVLSYTQP